MPNTNPASGTSRLARSAPVIPRCRLSAVYVITDWSALNHRQGSPPALLDLRLVHPRPPKPASTPAPNTEAVNLRRVRAQPPLRWPTTVLGQDASADCSPCYTAMPRHTGSLGH